MKVRKAIRKRRSIRSYKEKPVTKKKLRKVFDAARWTPSSGNKQPWEFIVIKDQDTRDKIAEEATYGDFISDAPVSVAFITDPGESNAHKIDGALATQNFQLAAWALGLGTCWIGTMNREKVGDGEPKKNYEVLWSDKIVNKESKTKNNENES